MLHPGSTAHTLTERGPVFQVYRPSSPAYLARRDVSQRLEGQQVFENERGEGHLQSDRRAVIYGPGKGPKEDFGKLGGKKGQTQADANPDVSGGNAGNMLEDLVNENCL